MEGDKMTDKKDPGKFTVRFNAADPQQRTVIDLLNRQGRYKAQFLVNAILHYIHCPETPDVYAYPMMNHNDIADIVKSVLAQQQAKSTPSPIKETQPVSDICLEPNNTFQESEGFGAADRDAITRTLNAFRSK